MFWGPASTHGKLKERQSRQRQVEGGLLQIASQVASYAGSEVGWNMIRLVVYLHVNISESPVLEDRQVEAMRERQKMRWIQEEIRQVPALTQGTPETWESG